MKNTSTDEDCSYNVRLDLQYDYQGSHHSESTGTFALAPSDSHLYQLFAPGGSTNTAYSWHVTVTEDMAGLHTYDVAFSSIPNVGNSQVYGCNCNHPCSNGYVTIVGKSASTSYYVLADLID